MPSEAPDPPPPTTVLTIRTAGRDDATLALTKREITLGSGPHCDVRLDDGADPVHCLIAATRQGYVVEDLRSSTGTFLDDRRISQAFVEPGQVIRAASTTILVAGG